MTSTTHRPAPGARPSAGEMARWLSGQLLDADAAATDFAGLATLAEAQSKDISFVAGDKALKEAAASRAGLLIVAPRHADALAGRARLVVDEVWSAVAELMARLYAEPAPPPGVHETAVLGPTVAVHPTASVGPCCVIGAGCTIDEGAVLGPHCILAPGTRIGIHTRLVARVTIACPARIGARVLIHPGAVIGADGFKFENVGGRPLKIPQVGTVVIEDEVEIGANTTIDRAFLYETRIGRGTKIDNLVQVAHNVQVGPGCLMAAQVGIAGSTRVGAGVLMGGQAGIRDGVTIGEGAMIGAQAGIHADVAAGAAVQGTPAVSVKQFYRTAAALGHLPEYARRLRALELKLGLGGGEEPGGQAPPRA